ncbi:endogenous retrovirus group K member 8 Gag polyprotein-like [Heliangelus exortis]|uniref:endogenous retrovirus group K member 8 Gag polyprotein-like n=1 Tax=Heliangelus exortis TaxID=472823 RepID=UPI003A8F4C98
MGTLRMSSCYHGGECGHRPQSSLCSDESEERELLRHKPALAENPGSQVRRSTTFPSLPLIDQGEKKKKKKKRKKKKKKMGSSELSSSPSSAAAWELWQEVSNLLGSLHTQEMNKNITGLDGTWGVVINALKEIKAEAEAAITAIAALPPNAGIDTTAPPPEAGSGVVPTAPPLPTPPPEGGKTRKALLGLRDNSLAIKGMPGKSHHSIAKFLSDIGPEEEKEAPAPSTERNEQKNVKTPAAHAPEMGGPSCCLKPPLLPPPSSEKEHGKEAATPPAAPIGLEDKIKALLEQTNQAVKSLEKRMTDMEQRLSFHKYRDPPTLPDNDEEDIPTPLLSRQNNQGIKGADKPRPGRWSGLIRDAILEGDWEASTIACPVLHDNNGPPQFKQHSWKTLQQAKKTLREGGLKSESGQAVLDLLFTADTNCPHDCRSLARYLLTPSQQIVWAKEWERLAQVEANRPRAPGDPLSGITAEMLTGSGRYADVQVQLQFPTMLHHIAAHLARQAFYVVPEPTPVPSFTAIKQGMNEPFQHFVDRLWQSIMAQSELGAEQKESMFKLLAFENANPRMKSLFSTLPKTADVSEMLEVAARATQTQQNQGMARAFAAALEPTQKLLAAVAQKLDRRENRYRRRNQSRKSTPVCFRCGATGHSARACSATVWCD